MSTVGAEVDVVCFELAATTFEVHGRAETRRESNVALGAS